MARTDSYVYWHAPVRAAMLCAEGAWTDDDKAKLGGAFATPLEKDEWISLVTTSDFLVKAATIDDPIIGKIISKPQGPHVENARNATVLLLGDFVEEIEIHTASAGGVKTGESVQFSVSGGKYGEGVWAEDSTSNGSIALASCSATPSSGTVIPVLFGYKGF